MYVAQQATQGRYKSKGEPAERLTLQSRLFEYFTLLLVHFGHSLCTSESTTMPPVDLKKPVDYGALKDRNVLISGGASGLGKSFVHLFVEKGANVVIADLQDGPGKNLEQELSDKGGKSVFGVLV